MELIVVLDFIILCRLDTISIFLNYKMILKIIAFFKIYVFCMLAFSGFPLSSFSECNEYMQHEGII